MKLSRNTNRLADLRARAARLSRALGMAAPQGKVPAGEVQYWSEDMDDQEVWYYTALYYDPKLKRNVEWGDGEELDAASESDARRKATDIARYLQQAVPEFNGVLPKVTKIL